MARMLHARPRPLTLTGAVFLVMTAVGCEDERGPTPTAVCDWLDACYGPQPPGCEKNLVPMFQQAAEAGCSAELADQFECMLELDCASDFSECEDESIEFSECFGLPGP